MEEMLKLLNRVNNEEELFEKLLEAVLDDAPIAKVLAARIVAGRDIRFDLEKVVKENNKRGIRPEVPGTPETEG